MGNGEKLGRITPCLKPQASPVSCSPCHPGLVLPSGPFSLRFFPPSPLASLSPPQVFAPVVPSPGMLFPDNWVLCILRGPHPDRSLRQPPKWRQGTAVAEHGCKAGREEQGRGYKDRWRC